jgi:hypothetical protein
MCLNRFAASRGHRAWQYDSVVIVAIQVAVLAELIVMVKGKDTSTRGASLASIQPREESLINSLCESIAIPADLFIAGAKCSKLRSAR